jgi:hypothetical protein
MQTPEFQQLNQHIIEYYQDGKFIGVETFDGQVDQSEIGYANGKLITNETKKFKRIFVASIQSPFKIVKYNLQGRMKR